MKAVSQNYNEVMNQVVRPTSKFQASIEMIDRSVEGDATVTTSEATSFSSGVLDKVHECDYAIFDQDFIKVGSNLRILPTYSYSYLKNGYVSSVICDENGVFQEVPIIEVQFGSVRNFIAMTYEFGMEYPTQIRVTYYLEGVEKGQFISTPNGVNFVDAVNHIGDCDKITFEFLSMSKPFYRVRVGRLIFGYEKKFEMSDLISTDHTMSIDPLSSSLPYEKLAIKVSNLNRDYNPDNPHGLWEFFQNGMPISIRYGINNGGATEWLEAGRLFLSDAPTVDGTTATFNAVDLLSTLTDDYYKGVWRPNGISLYDLAVEVLSDAGVVDYRLDESLKQITTVAPLPIIPHRECLQLIANVGECVLYTNTKGQIVIEKQILNEAPNDYYLDFSKMFNKPVVKKTEELKSVDVSVHTLTKEEALSELSKYSDIEIYGEQEVRVEYDTATDVEAVVEGGEILSATYYARTAILNIRADAMVNVVVKGHKIIDDTTIVSTKVSSRGEICPLENPLVTTDSKAKSLGEWVATYLSSRNTYETNFRQDFALDVNDVIRIRSEFEENIPARITKLRYKLPGQQGTISVRRVSDGVGYTKNKLG